MIGSANDMVSQCVSALVSVCVRVGVSAWNGWVTHRSDERVSVSGCEFDQLVIWLVSVLVSGCVSAWDGWVAHRSDSRCSRRSETVTQIN